MGRVCVSVSYLDMCYPYRDISGLPFQKVKFEFLVSLVACLPQF